MGYTDVTHIIVLIPERTIPRRANDRTRTGDLFITNELLYQLSYVGGRAETYADLAERAKRQAGKTRETGTTLQLRQELLPSRSRRHLAT